MVMGTEAGTTDTEPAIGEADYHYSVEVSTNFVVVLIIFRKCASLLKPPTSAVHLFLLKIGTLEEYCVREMSLPPTGDQITL